MTQIFRLAILLLLIAFPKASCLAQSQNISSSRWNSRRLTVADGLPSNTIRAFVQDADGYIWMGGSGGLCRYDGHQFISFSTVADTPNSITIPQVALLNFDAKTNLLHITTTTGEQLTMSSQSAILIPQKGMTSKEAAIPPYVVKAIPNGLYQGQAGGYYFMAQLHSGTVWLIGKDGTRHSFNLIPQMGILWEKKHLFFPAEGPDGRIYIATYGAGLYIIDPHTWQMEHFSAQDSHPLFGSDYLQAILIDHSGNIWISADNAGVACLSPVEGALVSYVLPVPHRSGYRDNSIRRIFRNTKGEIMVVANDDKVYTFDPVNLTLHYSTTLYAGVYAYYVDLSGRVWRGTRGDGLYVGNDHYATDEPSRRLTGNNVYGIAADRRGRIWVSTNDGGLCWAKYKPSGNMQFHIVRSNSEGMRRQNALLITREGILLVATLNGLYSLDTRQANPGGLQPVKFESTTTTKAIYLMQSADGSLRINTMGEGVIHGRLSADGRRLTATVINQQNGLSSNQTATLLQDTKGNIWVSCEQGLTLLDSQGHNPHNFLWNNSPLSDAYMIGSGLAIPDGRLLLGTHNGLAVVTPLPQRKKVNLQLYITNIFIGGIAQYDLLDNYADIVTGKKKLILDYDQNNLKISFSTLNYQHAALYQYWLEGYDDNWSSPTTQWTASYNHLSPGSYILHARTINGNKTTNETTMTITIRQPWWNSWWAWMLYIIIISTVATVIIRQWLRNFNIRQKMRLQEQMIEMRLDFFTQITHEFRTPLYIISSCIDHFSHPSTSTSISSQGAVMQTAQRATRHLLRLVSQLMEFRRLKAQQTRLAVEPTDVVLLVRQLCDDFRTMAQKRRISLTFLPGEPSLTLPVDTRLVEAITYNLISNAVKYTPEGGSVLVTLHRTGDMLKLIVDDSGPGISTEQQDVLFEPFMRGKVSTGGMGIGLYNAHAMAKVHHGDLRYEPSEKLCGASFVLTLPANSAAYTSEEQAKPSTFVTTTSEQQRQSEAIIQEMQPEALNDVEIAVVEDDVDMMQLIKTEMSAFFHIVTYSNGKQALDDIISRPPELIICDVMLPGYDGYEITRQLRSHAELSETPIILLTALDDESHQLKGYQAGADDYMIKPVNFRLLQARAIQLITWARRRKAQKAQLLSVIPTSHTETTPLSTTDSTSPLITTAADKRFHQQLDAIISVHINDPSLTVDKLAEMMMMGHTKFYGKVHQVTGVSPNQYLLRCRMEHAAELLIKGDKTVSEVAYSVGFKDPSYFNKVFKKHFGTTANKYSKAKT
jgi:signal transduction histidine kinase/ligand-binding sensor domain-containing protein/AraC-like DNA-binding protein/CheY-like chemotaxis protein